MFGHFVKISSFVIIIVLSLITTSCSKMGNIVSVDEIKKLSSFSDNDSDHEVVVARTGAIIYIDKPSTKKNHSNFVNFPDRKSFGPGSIEFGPEDLN